MFKRNNKIYIEKITNCFEVDGNNEGDKHPVTDEYQEKIIEKIKWYLSKYE